MTLRIGWTLRAGMLATLVACGDSGGAGDGTADGGGSGSGGEATGGDSDGMNGSCDRMGRDVTMPSPRVLSNLTVVGDTLVFLAGDPTFVMPATIESVRADGSGSTVLHTSTGKRRVQSVFASGENVFFYGANEEVVPKHELFKLPLDGGTAVRVGTVANEDGYIFGVDEANVYLVRNTDQPVGSVFERVDIATGSLTRVATITGTGTPSHVTLSGDDVFFYAGFAGSGSRPPPNVYGFAKSGDNVTPGVLWEAGTSDQCGFPLGGLVATPTKLTCGFAAVVSRDRDGSDPVQLIDNDITSLHVVVASDAENLYLIERSDGRARDARMMVTPSDAAEVTTVVCDLGQVSNQLVGGFFPIANEYEVAVGSSDIFWVEQNNDGNTAQYRLRAATK